MIIRRAGERGYADLGWLQTRRTFSFAEYYDEQWMGFGPLRAINEDRIQGGSGFSWHGHHDMEIFTCILEGALRHEDSTGHQAILHAGEVQRMTAGTGIFHEEMNASAFEECHFYQIWISPETRGLTPSYDQKPFWGHLKQMHKVLVASPDGRYDSLRIHQRAEIWLQQLKAGEGTTISVPGGKSVWVQIAAGAAVLQKKTKVEAGDGIALEKDLNIAATADLELLEIVL